MKIVFGTMAIVKIMMVITMIIIVTTVEIIIVTKITLKVMTIIVTIVKTGNLESNRNKKDEIRINTETNI